MSEGEGKQLPHDLEAEQAVLACVLTDGTNLARVLDTLAPGDFYNGAHRNIFGSVVELHKRHEPIDLVTVCSELRSVGKLDSVGGRQYITDLYMSHAIAVNLEHYAKTVHKHSIRRQVVRKSREMAESAMDEDALEPTLALASTAVMELTEKAAIKSATAIKDVAVAVMEEIVSRVDNPGVQGVPFGFADLDALTGGARGGDLNVVAARTGMGKTQFMLNTTFHACTGKYDINKKTYRTVWFSYEMTSDELVERLFSLAGEIEAKRIRDGELVEEDWIALNMAQLAIVDMPLEVFDMRQIGRTVQHMRGAILKLIAAGKKPEKIVVDHSGFVRSSKDYENRTQEVGEIVTDLKYLAVELDIPIFLICQLSRKCEERQNKRPMLSDLRESGDIEQTANNVFFIYRDDYYNKEAENKGETEVIVAKARNGEVGTIHLTFQSSIGRFHSFDRDQWSKPAGTAAPKSRYSNNPHKHKAPAGFVPD